MKKLIIFSKKFFVFCISLTLVFVAQISSIIAIDNIDISAINQEYNITIDQSSKINLYDKDDSIIAVYYKLEDIGYVIIDYNTSEIIEFSTESNNLFIKDSNNKYYYGGVLNYFIETSDENKILKIDSNELVDKEAAVLCKNEKRKVTGKSLYTLPLNVTFETAYKPRLYDTNQVGICGSTAAAIILAYYFDHISPAYVLPNLITSDGYNLTYHMVPYIDGAPPYGSNYYDMVNGLNSYLRNQGLLAVAKILNVVQGADHMYTYRVPVIAGVPKHPTYQEHWVVAYGFRCNNALISYYIVNNGWGQNGINISSNYLDGAVPVS